MSEDLRFKGYTFKNFPINKSLNDYEVARKEIIEKFSKLEENIGIVEWGTIPYPGISDMDTYIMLDERVNYKKIQTPKLSQKTWEILHHNVFYMWDNLYKDIALLDPWIVKHTRTYGNKDYSFKVLDKKNPTFPRLSISHVIMAYIITLKHFILEIEESKSFNVLDTLETMRVLLYVLREVKLYIKPSLDYNQFSFDIDKLRDNWFNFDKNKQIKDMFDLFQLFKSEYYNVVNIIDKYLVENNFTPNLSKKEFNKNYTFWKTIKVNFSNKKSHLIRLKNTNFSVISLPKNFIYYFEYIYYNENKKSHSDDYFFLKIQLIKKFVALDDRAMNLKFPTIDFGLNKVSWKMKIARKIVDIIYFTRILCGK